MPTRSEKREANHLLVNTVIVQTIRAEEPSHDDSGGEILTGKESRHLVIYRRQIKKSFACARSARNHLKPIGLHSPDCRQSEAHTPQLLRVPDVADDPAGQDCAFGNALRLLRVRGNFRDKAGQFGNPVNDGGKHETAGQLFRKAAYVYPRSRMKAGVPLGNTVAPEPNDQLPRLEPGDSVHGFDVARD